MWIRKTPQGWALARPLQFAAGFLAAFAGLAAGLALFASLTMAGYDFLVPAPRHPFGGKARLDSEEAR